MNKLLFSSLTLSMLLYGSLAHANGTARVDAVNTSIFDSSWTTFQVNSSNGQTEDSYLEPGQGQQGFDAEYLLYKIDHATNKLLLGMQTGFDIVDGTYKYGTKDYYAGDLFLSFNGSSTWDYAVDFGNLTKDYYKETPVGGVLTGTPGTDKAGLYKVIETNNDVYYKHTASNPFAMQEGELLSSSTSFVTDAGADPSKALSYWRTVELSLGDLIDEGINSQNGFSFAAHWTMSCGNDEMHGTVDVAPVPEPATMFLFGIGLTGLAGLSRRRREKA